jgi:type IV secretory pathway VirB3-like protein
MQSAVIYSTLTKPEMIFGLPKEALPIIGGLFAIFMLGKVFMNYSILWGLPFIAIIYLLFFIVGKVDPFYFSVMQKKSSLRTPNFNKHKGNYYAS